MMEDTLIDSFKKTIRENPNTISLREIFSILEDPIFSDRKEKLLDLTMAEIFNFNRISSEKDCIAAIIQNQDKLQMKTITEIATILGCGREIVVKVVSFAKQDTNLPIKIEQVGEKRGARYKIINK